MKHSQKKYTTVMRYASLGVQWFVLLGVGVWGGIKLDEKAGWQFPVLTISLPLLALGISLWQLIRQLSKPDK